MITTRAPDGANKNLPPEKPRQSQWWEDAAKTKEEESHQR